MRPRPAQWLAAVLLSFASLASAEPFGYAAGFNELYRVNVATGQATRVGAMGFNDVEGLALSPGGTLFGVADATMMIGNQPSASSDFLLRINPANGAGTLVGQLSGLQGLGPAGNLDYGLAFTCDGRLWMSSDTTGELWSVDPATAETRRIGVMGAPISGLAARGNVLFGVSVEADPALFAIDTANASVRRIGGIALPAVMYDAGLDFDADGRLWLTVDYLPPPSGTTLLRNDLVELDPATARVISLTTIGGAGSGINTVQMEALAVAPPGGCSASGGGNSPPPIVVPGPGAPALLLLAGLAGWFGRRRLRAG